MNSTDAIGSFEERAFPRFRIPTLDSLRWGRRRHHVPVLLEVDVTAARDAIRRRRAATGQGVSFTAWVVRCLGRAASEHPHVHALRSGRRKLIVFRDVDVAVLVERSVGPGAAGESLPMPCLIRRTNERSLEEIHAAIRAAQEAPLAEGEVQVEAPRAGWTTRLFTRLPKPARDLLVWRRLYRNPYLAKRMMGTVGVTAIGMMGGGGIGWGIPVGMHPLIVAVGGIARRPALLGGQLIEREVLGLTVLFDHDVTDGAPVARFLARLQQLMQTAYGLDDSEPAPDPSVEGPASASTPRL